LTGTPCRQLPINRARRDEPSATVDREGLDDAAGVAELSREKWRVQLGGDSVFAILPNGVDVTRLMDCFVRELDVALGAYNRRRAGQAWTRMRLRLAVHAGLVDLAGETGWPGQHAVLPARLRDSEPIRAALKACPNADLAVIVSADVFRDYITQGPGSPRPTEFRAVLAHGKQETHTAHLYLPGFDVHSISALERFDVPNVRPSTGSGDSRTSDQGHDESERAVPSATSEPSRSRRVSAGRDVIGGARNTLCGSGTIVNVGRDARLVGGRQERTGDER
jgi:hypothetical protein